MHLPEHIAAEYSIDYERYNLKTGDTVYYAPDGTLQRVTAASDDAIHLTDLTDNVDWVAKRKSWQDGLYSDFFPLE